MKVVIQCASSKFSYAGRMKTQQGVDVMFVAQPGLAPKNPECVYAKPDDVAYGGTTWRELLAQYNANRGKESIGLLPAWQLYENPIYGRLAEQFDVDNVFILSAGWGLISATYLTPYYDITFSSSAEDYKRRRKADSYQDQCMAQLEDPGPLVFFGGKDYLPLFQRLTEGYAGPRSVFYNSVTLPNVRGCRLIRFETPTRTNWHYECAQAFIDGRIRT